MRKGKAGMGEYAQCTISACMKTKVKFTKSLFPEVLLPSHHSVYLLSHLQKLRPPLLQNWFWCKFVLWAPVGMWMPGLVRRILRPLLGSTPRPSASYLLTLRGPSAETETDMLSQAKVDQAWGHARETTQLVSDGFLAPWSNPSAKLVGPVSYPVFTARPMLYPSYLA